MNCEKIERIEMLGKAKLASFIHRHPHARPLFMEEGAPCHRPKMTKNWHVSKGIQRLESWPGQSQDSNPIQNVWGIMKRMISRKNTTIINEIKMICKKVWKRFTPIYLSSLFAAMLCHMELCIQANGGSTKY